MLNFSWRITHLNLLSHNGHLCFVLKSRALFAFIKLSMCGNCTAIGSIEHVRIACGSSKPIRHEYCPIPRISFEKSPQIYFAVHQRDTEFAHQFHNILCAIYTCKLLLCIENLVLVYIFGPRNKTVSQISILICRNNILVPKKSDPCKTEISILIFVMKSYIYMKFTTLKPTQDLHSRLALKLVCSSYSNIVEFVLEESNILKIRIDFSDLND